MMLADSCWHHLIAASLDFSLSLTTKDLLQQLLCNQLLVVTDAATVLLLCNNTCYQPTHGAMHVLLAVAFAMVHVTAS